MRTTILLLLSVTGALAQLQPAYPAGPPENREITRTMKYVYRETRYDPPFVITPVQRAQARNTTPEEALTGRASALAALDYDWFLDTWDPESKELMLEREKTLKQHRAYWVTRWQGVYDANRFAVGRKIETRGYVVLMYKLINAAGNDIAGFEMPAVMKRVGDGWFASQDLSSDGLIPNAPWITGQTRKEVQVR